MSESFNAQQAAEWLGISRDDFGRCLDRREVPRPLREGTGLFWTAEQITTFLKRRLYEPGTEVYVSPESAERMETMLRAVQPGVVRVSHHRQWELYEEDELPETPQKCLKNGPFYR